MGATVAEATGTSTVVPFSHCFDNTGNSAFENYTFDVHTDFFPTRAFRQFDECLGKNI